MPRRRRAVLSAPSSGAPALNCPSRLLRRCCAHAKPRHLRVLPFIAIFAQLGHRFSAFKFARSGSARLAGLGAARALGSLRRIAAESRPLRSATGPSTPRWARSRPCRAAPAQASPQRATPSPPSRAASWCAPAPARPADRLAGVSGVLLRDIPSRIRGGSRPRGFFLGAREGTPATTGGRR